jgi:hypothetical protein
VIRALASVLAAAFALCAADAAAINKCVDPSGKVVYQEDKCPDNAKAGTVKVQPSSSPVAKGDGSAKSLPADIDRVIEVEAGFNVCSYGPSGWFEANRGAYEAWARRNFALTSKIHGDYELEKEFQSRSARKTSADAGLCTSVAEAIRK